MPPTALPVSLWTPTPVPFWPWHPAPVMISTTPGLSTTHGFRPSWMSFSPAETQRRPPRPTGRQMSLPRERRQKRQRHLRKMRPAMPITSSWESFSSNSGATRRSTIPMSPVPPIRSSRSPWRWRRGPSTSTVPSTAPAPSRWTAGPSAVPRERATGHRL